MDTRTCSACKRTLGPVPDHFHPRYDRPGRFRSTCKECSFSRYRDNERTRATRRRFNRSDKGRALQAKNINRHKNRRLWPSNSREAKRERVKRYRADGTLARYDRAHYQRHRLSKNFGRYIRLCLNGRKNGARWESIVGYTVDDLRTHLERQFSGRMTWANYGTYWQVDHILPVSMFQFSGPDDPQFKVCWALSNLRPLRTPENQEKRDKRLFLL